MKDKRQDQRAIILKNGEGRHYDCGDMRAVFKADEEETAVRYSISEWWLEPHTEGPGAHLHEANEEIFYILEGCMSVMIGDKWIEAEKGSFLRIPANTLHDFANRSPEKSGLLNFYIPGGFERDMPAIVDWFEKNR